MCTPYVLEENDSWLSGFFPACLISIVYHRFKTTCKPNMGEVHHIPSTHTLHSTKDKRATSGARKPIQQGKQPVVTVSQRLATATNQQVAGIPSAMPPNSHPCTHKQSGRVISGTLHLITRPTITKRVTCYIPKSKGILRANSYVALPLNTSGAPIGLSPIARTIASLMHRAT